MLNVYILAWTDPLNIRLIKGSWEKKYLISDWNHCCAHCLGWNGYKWSRGAVHVWQLVLWTLPLHSKLWGLLLTLISARMKAFCSYMILTWQEYISPVMLVCAVTRVLSFLLQYFVNVYVSGSTTQRLKLVHDVCTGDLLTAWWRGNLPLHFALWLSAWQRQDALCLTLFPCCTTVGDAASSAIMKGHQSAEPDILP